MFWLCILCAALTTAVVLLSAKIVLMRRAAGEICESFDEKLNTETNTLISISSHDKVMCRLANSLNAQLRKLRNERRRFLQGDLELKNAVTNISHDLRTPLTAIFGYLDLLEQEETSPAADRYIGIIRNRTEILTQLTEELFRYSIILTPEGDEACETVVVNSILEESIAAFYASFKERGITPQIRIPEKKVFRFLNRQALSRVFSNLLNNALKYSDGDLDITLSRTGEITFVNTASGLNEVQVGKLFDRFYTVEAARKSTGLGLAIARTLVEQMNGSITASYENHRLFIRIMLPETDPLG